MRGRSTGDASDRKERQIRRRNAALNAWKTRRRRAAALKAWETRRRNIYNNANMTIGLSMMYPPGGPINDDEIFVLGPGDAFYFDSRRPHRFRNIGKGKAQAISVNTPPSF